MEADVLNALETQLTYITAGRNRDDRISIIVPVQNELQAWTKRQIELSFEYLFSILSDETKKCGAVIIIDAQKCSWRLARSHMRFVATVIGTQNAKIIVIRPDVFWDKQRVENCAKSFRKGQPNIIPKSRLTKYFELTELPEELGGTLYRNHSQWISHQKRIEEFKISYESLLCDLETIFALSQDYKNSLSETEKLVNNINTKRHETEKRIQTIIESGKSIIANITITPPRHQSTKFAISQDLFDGIDIIRDRLNTLRARQDDLVAAWTDIEKSIDFSRQLSLLGSGVSFVTSWILGTAEQHLNDNCKVGFDVPTAEEYRNKHEALELQCWDTFGVYAKLLYKINKLPVDNTSNILKDLLLQRDFMSFVCRSFAGRLERRRNVLITSHRFFRMVSDYFDKTNEVFQAFVSGTKLDEYEKTMENLKKLRENKQYLDNIEREVIKEGEKLSDMLSMPIKDALGCEINVDYSEAISNVRDILDATIARRKIFVDSVELQKLTFDQIIHVYMYEKDGEMALKWIEDLYNVMIKSHIHVGCNVNEIQLQKEELQSFQETAKGTFHYGCQVLSAARTLRESCKMQADKNIQMSDIIHQTFKNLDIVSQEQMTRLRVSAVFHRSVEEQCEKLETLRDSVISIVDFDDPNERRQNLKMYLQSREKLLVDIGRMVRLGRLLKTRLKEPFFFDEGNSARMTDCPKDKTSEVPLPENNIACESICAKLSEISKLAEEVDLAFKNTQHSLGLEKVDINASVPEKNSDELTTVEDWNSCLIKSSKSSTEDESFITASEFTYTPQSRSSSYHTASECRTTSPWWDNEHNSLDSDSLELDSQLPSLNFIPGGLVTTPRALFDDSANSSLSIQKSLTLSDLDEGKKSSTDNFSSDSLSNKEQTPTREVPQLRQHLEVQQLHSSVTSSTGTVADHLIEKTIKSGDIYNIKVIEMEPKLTSIGLSLDEALQLQKEHDEMLQEIQEQNTPLEELEHKVKQLLAKDATRHEVLKDMTSSMELTWSDINKMFLERKFILDQNVNFHEKMEECRGKMSALEMSCRDTMIPIEIESVLEYLDKFKQLRTDVLTSVMIALKEGSALVDRLKRLFETGSVDSRPDHIKTDATKSIHQIEVLLEELHDKRNTLETAWQTRKTQLEQCYALAVLAKDIIELEDLIERRRSEILNSFSLGDSETTSDLLLKTYIAAREDAISLRDKALRITKATEQLVLTGCFAGDQASQKAYHILENTTEYFDEIDRREALLEQAKEFFLKAEKVLSTLEKLEVDVSTSKLPPESQERLDLNARILNELDGLIDEPVCLGNALLATVYHNPTESSGIKRTIEEMENRKVYLENVCSTDKERNIQIQQQINMFLENYNNILSWLVSIAEIFLKTNKDLGSSLYDGREFLNLHHQLLSDLEMKGTDINSLLLTLPPILEHLDDNQRLDIDRKVESLHQHWTDLKKLVETRVDLVTLFIEFFLEAENLTEMFNFAENMLKTTPEQERLKQFETAWEKIKPTYAQLKTAGNGFLNEASKIADPYLETKNASLTVEEILNSISNRQFDITDCWESWTTSVVTKRETELILEKIMTENVRVMMATSKLDAQLYPVLNFETNEPSELRVRVSDKLDGVLAEIGKAQFEIRKRIETTKTLTSQDDEMTDRIEQMKTNLGAITGKLEDITRNYKNLLLGITEYLNNLTELKISIEEYFADKSIVPSENIDQIYEDYKQFKDRTMERFRYLIKESESLVDQVKSQEPHGASEYDAERIISLLEGLRVIFETQNNETATSFQRQQIISQFNRDANETTKNLDDMNRQLNEVRTQFGESPAATKATSLAFEYFEQTIEMLQKRLESLTTTSETIVLNYPDAGNAARQEIQNLIEKWTNFRTDAKNTRQLINLANDYFSLHDKIDTKYREHSTYLFNIINKLPNITSVDEAADLINNINNYIILHEEPQMNDLKKLAQLSYNAFGHDKSTQLYSDNVALFQSYVKLKADVSAIIVKFNIVENDAETIDVTDKMVSEKLQEVQNEREIITLISYEPPSFKEPLKNVTITEGERLSFECIITGFPEPRVEWFKDGLSIQGNHDYRTVFSEGVCRLSIDETFAADSASFTCKATNSVGSAETTAILTVTEVQDEKQLTPPTFTKYLTSGKAREGTCFEFRCSVIGYPLPEIQWFKNDVCIDNSRDYVITFNNGDAMLKFEEVFLEDKAVYVCKAINTAGAEQCWASLDVEPLEPTELPQFQQPLSNVMARVGQKIKLECIVTGLPEPQITWNHNGKPYGSTRTSESKLQYENGRATLTINEAFLKDAGVYMVKAENLAGETSSACNVIVKGRLPNETSDSELASDMEPIKPSVQLPLKNVTIIEGKSVRLDCIIVGQPEPEVIWYHNERPVKESPDCQLLFQGDRCSLVLRETYIDDSGDYRVVAINSAGEASSACNLTVTPFNDLEPAATRGRLLPTETPPHFEKLLSDILAPEGERVVFECILGGDPKPNVKWFVNNKILESSDRIQTVQSETDGVVQLIMEKVSINDKGLYTVKATNSSGEAKCFSHLIVKSVNTPEALQQQQSETFVEMNQISPTFKELFSNKTAHIDECTKFECIVVGKPTPKVKWYFNDELVHGKDFLISTSGNRQVLTVPSVTSATVGKISCIAENDAGKATCVAYLNLYPASNGQTISNVQNFTEEHQTGVSSVTIKKQMFTSTSTTQVNSTSTENGVPQTQIHKTVIQQDQGFKQLGDHTPEIHESKQIQEYHQTNETPVSIQQNSTVTITKATPAIEVATKPKRKSVGPRFVSPFVGKIVDQGADVTFEAILDGFPSPEVKISKNGENLYTNDHVKIQHSLNKVTVELKNVGIKDAGRYTCSIQNNAGTSTSTADLVVKKSIFPPVFGRRLQAQVVKKGERVIMEVEITGTPEPTVTWFKDNRPLKEVMTSEYRLNNFGIGHTLIIDKVNVKDSGKYMVRSTNAGGEAQSIADFRVLEPTPERMVEVVKTVVFDEQPIHIPIQTIPITHEQKQESQSNYINNDNNNSESQTYHTSHQKTFTESDARANEESTFITETTRTTEATMRMEHKLTFPDLPDHLVPSTSKVSGSSQTPIIETASAATMIESVLKSQSTNTEQYPTKIGITQTPPLPIETPAFVRFDNKPPIVETFKPIKLDMEVKTQHEEITPIKLDFEIKSQSNAFNLIKIDIEPKIIPEVLNTDPEKPSEDICNGKPKPVYHVKQVSEHIETKPVLAVEMKPIMESVLTADPLSMPSFEAKTEHLATVCEPKAVQESFVQSTPVSELEQSTIETNSISKQTAFDFFMNKIKAQPEDTLTNQKYMKYEETQNQINLTPMRALSETTQPQHHLIEFGLEPGSPPVYGIMPQQLDSPKSGFEPIQISKQIHTLNTQPEPEKTVTTQVEHLKSVFDTTQVQQHTNQVKPIELPKLEPFSEKFESFERNEQFLKSEVNYEPIFRPQAIAVKHLETIVDIRSQSPRPSAEGIAMEKLWASHKTNEPDKFIPQPQEDQKPSFLPTTEEYFSSIRRSSLKDTKQICENSSSSFVAKDIELKTPSLVKMLTQNQLQQPLEQQHDIILKPASPPQICFAPEPFENILKTETLREHYEETVKFAHDSAKLACEEIKPPLPSREVKPAVAPPLPARPEYVHQQFIPVTKPMAPLPKVPTPTKFTRAEFTESDYESDFESRVNTTWQPYESDSSDPKYRSVAPPKESPVPIKFIEPQKLIELAPQSEPAKPIPAPKPQKFKLQQSSGYMADTEDVTNRNFESSFDTVANSSFTSTYQESKSQVPQPPFLIEKSQIPTKYYRHHIHKHDKKDESSGDYTKESTLMKNISMTSKHIKYNKEVELEPLPFTPDPPKPHKTSMKVPPPPNPSRFIKGEFRESDYESDYECRIAPVWRPTDSDSEPSYKPVRPVLTPTGYKSNVSDSNRSVTPPTEFDRPPQFQGPPRPKFEPIEVPKFNIKLDEILQPKPHAPVFKPTPVNINPRPVAPSHHHEPQIRNVKYYTAIAGAPIHTQNYATETSNTVHMKESTEKSQRVVNITQTRRIIPIGNQITQSHEKQHEIFSSEAEPTFYSTRTRVPMPPTPTRFVRGEFRESDYESEVESARIRPLWTPNPSDNEEPRYRPVSAPRPSRATSLPRTNNCGRIVSPLEFDTAPPVTAVIKQNNSQDNLYRQHQTRTQTIDRFTTKKQQTFNVTRDDIDLKPGSPPEYGYINSAENQIQDMKHTFKSKAENFIQDLSSLRQAVPQKPILKKTHSVENSGENQAYREESRVSQYGTKHIDPNTGLIYFKYDFGYEFGILFPGEGKKFIGSKSSKNTVEHSVATPQNLTKRILPPRYGDIELPVHHEKTAVNSRSGNFNPYSDNRTKRYSLPIELSIDEFHRENGHGAVQSTATTTTVLNNNQYQKGYYVQPQTQQYRAGSHPPIIVNHNPSDPPKRPPIFITPLKDIAVVSGQSARFECIVQCDPHPEIVWSRNGQSIVNNPNCLIEFRNGVCRLVVPQAFPGDAGTYKCSASNQLGTVDTMAELLVPGEKWGCRK